MKTYLKHDPTHRGPITLECRGYRTAADRKRAERLLRRSGAHVTTYRDAQAEFAIMVCRPKPEASAIAS